MTDTEAKALALLNEVRSEYPFAADYHAIGIALNRAIERHEADNAAHASQIYAMHSRIALAEEQHEAFKQEVSDVMTYIKALYPTLPRNFDRFIIPKPKPDPLAGVFDECFDNVLEGETWSESMARRTRAALEARGLEIREKGQ